MLQALNILENFDLKAMGHNSPRYVHTVYQAMNLAFADRDFYYGDIYAAPREPINGLLSKDYARARSRLVRADRNDPTIAPGDPYPFEGARNPFFRQLRNWHRTGSQAKERSAPPTTFLDFQKSFRSGTTSIEAADEEGWVVSITPSGGWVPAVVAGRTGVGLSQRAQSFVTDPAENPFNVIAPGKQPRVTLTPTMALKDGKPFLSFAVQGGDTQDQNLLQFFLNVVEFGMNVQEAAEAPNFNSYQMRASFGAHETQPGRLLLNESTPPETRAALERMGYTLEFEPRTSGPINAIFLDWANRSFWGGSSNYGDDYGIVW
jgi:gamma-glutamyltranspeptidase/glutathione hydrolase